MKKSITALGFLLALLLVGCSGETESNQKEQGGSSSDTEVHTIQVYGIDKLKFVVPEQKEGLQTGQQVTVNGQTYYELQGITAKAGQKLTIELTTLSKMPAKAMAHNWLLLKQNADAQAFTDASIKAKDNDYVAKEMEDQVITDTGLVPGGDTESTTFTVPGQTGDYQYICTFPVILVRVCAAR